MGQELNLTDPMDYVIGEDSDDIEYLYDKSLLIASELEDIIYKALLRTVHTLFSSE